MAANLENVNSQLRDLDGQGMGVGGPMGRERPGGDVDGLVRDMGDKQRRRQPRESGGGPVIGMWAAGVWWWRDVGSREGDVNG